jgi:peptide/nickel transport system substrate-binding protein
MVNKLIICIVALMVIIAMVLPGCGTTGLVGDPVSINMLIRNNDKRLEIGDYVGNQLEDLGFTVTRQYGAGRDLAPIWQGDPTTGVWNVYTGAWINTAVPRDEGANFANFFTPLGDPSSPLWSEYKPTEEFLNLATTLWNNAFSTLDERKALFEQALPLSMQDGARVFCDDRATFTPVRKNVAVAADAYGGVEGSMLWGPTVHFRNDAGTPLLPQWDGGAAPLTMKIALEDLLIQPWNGVGGSNWAFDQFPIRGTCEMGFEYDTRDGLVWPGVAQKAEVVVQAGLPVSQSDGSKSWLTVTTSPTAIAVPTTAWADWDAKTQKWITTAPGTTAKTKTVVYYPTGTFGRPLHDGSTLSAGDFMLYAIMEFDRGKSDSAIYDAAVVPQLEAFLEHFKGVEFSFNTPGYDLVVTTYDDLVQLDAELIARGNSWFPTGPVIGGNNLGPWIWHNLALGILAERDLKLAFSNDKATANSIEWLSFISGPSLSVLSGYLTAVLTSGNPDYAYIPYKSFLGTYITQAEALQRYQNLQAFYNANGHFWVASGVFYLKSVDTTGKKLELDAFQNSPADGSKFFFLVDPDPVNPPAHKGAWVDKVTLEIETDEAGVTRLQSGQLDIFAAGLADADQFETVKADPNLRYYLSAGLFDELTFNPSGPFFPGTGKLNPFAIPAVREAMNWAVDRSYIAGEIYGGMAYARYTCVGTKTGDYINRYPALFAATEDEYAFDFEKADVAIETAMLAIPGVTRAGDGKYYYEEPA